MGLDMYLEGRKFLWAWDKTTARREDGYEIKEVHLRLGYWRKHPDLHGYIVQQFADGVDKCQDIELDAAAIFKIMDAIKHAQLPHTEGFFFGHSEGTEAEQEADVAIFKRALAWLEDGKSEQPGLAPGQPLGHSGFVMAEVKMPETLPVDSRSIVYRASW